MDAHANFAYSIVATPPSPATSGMSVVLESGTGTRFPDPAPFNVVVWPEGEIALPENAEILRVTSIVDDVVTFSDRSQEGTTARAIVAGDQIAAMVTKKTLTDIESGRPVDRLYAATPDPLDVGTGGVGVALPWVETNRVGTAVTVDADDPTLIRFNSPGFYAGVASVGFNKNASGDPDLVYVFITTDSTSTDDLIFGRIPKVNLGVTLQDESFGDAIIPFAIQVSDEADPTFGSLAVGDWFSITVFNDLPPGANRGLIEGGIGTPLVEHTYLRIWRVGDFGPPPDAEIGGQALQGAFPSTPTIFNVPIEGIPTDYVVNVFDEDEPYLAIAQTGDEYAQQCFFTESDDGWFFGDGTFDAYVVGEVDSLGYAGCNIVPYSSGVFSVSAGGARFVARAGDPGNTAKFEIFLFPKTGSKGVFNVGTVGAGSGLIRSESDSDTGIDKIAFLGAAPAQQAAHIDPASITTEQIGQLLIDFGFVAP